MLMGYFDGGIVQESKDGGGGETKEAERAAKGGGAGTGGDGGGREGASVDEWVWACSARLPTHPQLRLLRLLDDMAPSPSFGCQWLSAAAPLLLRLARLSADYDRYLPGCVYIIVSVAKYVH